MTLMYACMLSCFSCVHLFVTLWTIACQAPLSIGFSRKEYWGGLPFPPAEDLPNPGIEPASPVTPALTGSSLLLAQLGSPKKLIPNLVFLFYDIVEKR